MINTVIQPFCRRLRPEAKLVSNPAHTLTTEHQYQQQ